jgi:hypothetical protein
MPGLKKTMLPAKKASKAKMSGVVVMADVSRASTSATAPSESRERIMS